MTTSQTTEYQKALKELEKASNELKALKKAYANLKKDYLALKGRATTTTTKKDQTAFEFIKTWTKTTKKHTKGDKESITIKQLHNAIDNMKTEQEKEKAYEQLRKHEAVTTPWYTIERMVKKTTKKKGESKK